jgi:hypothetical protein
MTSRFEVGEIAIVAGCTHPDWTWCNGIEVEIIGGLDKGEYPVESPRLRERLYSASIYCHPRLLRKRRPPPDWNAIAGVREREVV